MLEEYYSLILISQYVPELNIAPKLEYNNLSCSAQNHSSVTILKHFVYKWEMNISAEFEFPSIINS